MVLLEIKLETHSHNYYLTTLFGCISRGGCKKTPKGCSWDDLIHLGHMGNSEFAHLAHLKQSVSRFRWAWAMNVFLRQTLLQHTHTRTHIHNAHVSVMYHSLARAVYLYMYSNIHRACQRSM